MLFDTMHASSLHWEPSHLDVIIMCQRLDEASCFRHHATDPSRPGPPAAPGTPPGPHEYFRGETESAVLLCLSTSMACKGLLMPWNVLSRAKSGHNKGEC